MRICQNPTCRQHSLERLNKAPDSGKVCQSQFGSFSDNSRLMWAWGCPFRGVCGQVELQEKTYVTSLELLGWKTCSSVFYSCREGTGEVNSCCAGVEFWQSESMARKLFHGSRKCNPNGEFCWNKKNTLFGAQFIAWYWMHMLDTETYWAQNFHFSSDEGQDWCCKRQSISIPRGNEMSITLKPHKGNKRI